ncbi:BBT_HP_G0010040.mRNA.1.CDS.1 [Saccharomyces cerevisiae]|nr:BBT_HP_G0010040.mRNA.1.CDS.1 [Saccharomyces cerevisiae]CAI7010753.1 BBT_HP_G0010040.mRNA.1.CDS.1 [Saccharomyces cerevisiae]
MSFSVSSKTSKTTKLLVSSISESAVALIIIITIRILFSIGKSDFKKIISKEINGAETIYYRNIPESKPQGS